MGRKELLIDLYSYGEWAYGKLFAKIAELSDEQYRKVWSSGYQSIHHTLVHNFGADVRWLARWQGDPPPAMFNPAALTSAAEIQRRWADVAAKRRAYLDSLSEAQLEEPIIWQRGEERVTLPRWQAITTAATHGIQHRAEIAAMLTDAGFSPGNLDFFLYSMGG